MNRKLLVLAIIIFALVVPVSMLAAQSGPNVRGFVGTRGVPVGTEAVGDVLYDQTGDPSSAWTAQDFTDPGDDLYDNMMGADFQVPAGMVWTVDGFFLDGAYFNGVGPVDGFNLSVRANNAGVPGATQCNYAGVVPAGDVSGAVTFDLSANPCELPAGTYWVVAQALMPFSTGGQWGWTASYMAPTNYDAVWQNPNDGFGTGCTSWDTLYNCLTGPFGEGEHEVEFIVYGSAEAAEEEVPLGDSDLDDIPDIYDNCPYHINPDQADEDDDGIGDLCDYPVWVLLGCPNEVMTYLGYSGAGGDVACRPTGAADEWDVPAAPSGYSYVMDPAYEGYFTVFGIDAESGEGMTSLADPLTVCFDGGLGATAIGVYYDNLPVSGPEWMMLDTFAMNGDLCAASSQLGYFAAFTG